MTKREREYINRNKMFPNFKILHTQTTPDFLTGGKQTFYFHKNGCFCIPDRGIKLSDEEAAAFRERLSKTKWETKFDENTQTHITTWEINQP